MSKFVLTAELELRAPRNSRQIISNIQNQLNGVKIDLKVKNSAQAARQIAGVNKQLKESNDLASNLGKNLGVSIRRFTAFAIATRGVSLFTNSLSNATKEAIDFERELIKISQVTRRDIEDLQELENTITRLATSLGASSQSLLSATRILAQAGIEASRLEVALTALAKTTLAPTFEDIGKTAEGAIAILSQFGKGVGALEQQLGAINAVAGQFAVESGDLISAVRRTGGVFVSAGGQLEELLGLFTSVRATTRESAESIATGLRTILTRIQRPTTIKYLEQFGVKLTDLNGKFVGPFEAIKRLSQALRGLEQGDIKFVEIAEELGGFRQIGKVIPLLQQFEVAERARQAAIEGGSSLDEDARKAQASLAVQIEKTREKFLALIRSFSETGTFQTASRTVLRLADSFVQLADAIKPILPLIGAVGAFKALKGISGFGRALKGGFTGQTRNQGGKILGFNTGGFVPGVGNSDTVPAMLTPGEFVIRKASVKKLGTGNLAAMNENRYADGGFVSTKRLANPRVQGGKTIQNLLGANRGKGWTSIDEFKVPYRISQVDPYSKSVPKKLRDEYSESANASKRGFVFENIVSRVKKRKLNKNNEFLDAKNAEIKSDKRFSEKKSGGLKSSAYKTIVAKTLNTVLSRKKVEDLDFTSNKDKKDLSSYITAGQITVYTDPSIEKWESQNKNLGGLIQKFATGGIVDQKAAGAAILDPEAASSKKVNITGEDIKKEFTEFKSLPKGKDPVSKYYKSSSFNIAKSGLNKETSDKFKMSLEDGLVAGINTSTASLANDLGTPNAKIDKSQISNFIKSINTSIFGRLFETTMDSISRSGQYATPDNDSDRPFDAPNGLPASLKDNFSGLPDQYIDYKASLEAASDANMKGKIVDQIKRELIQDGILNEEYPRKEFRDKERASSQAKTEKKKRANQAAGRGFPVKRANGGPAPSDTVPALLTPGEFVFNEKSARSIGYANLNKMNKQGVAGFAKGGPVGFKRFAEGGNVDFGDRDSSNREVFNIHSEEGSQKFDFAFIDSLEDAVKELKTTLSGLGKSFDDIEAIGDAFGENLKEGGSALDILVSTLWDFGMTVEKTGETVESEIEGMLGRSNDKKEKTSPQKEKTSPQAEVANKKAAQQVATPQKSGLLSNANQKLDNINKKGEEVFEKVFKSIDRGGMKVYDFFADFASKAKTSGDKVSESLDNAAEEISKTPINSPAQSSLSNKPSDGQAGAGADDLINSTKELAEANKENADQVQKKSAAEIFGSITMASAFIPRVEEASTAAQRMQNSFLDSVTTISATITALEAFGISLNKQSLLGGFGGKGGFGKGFKNILKGVGARVAVFGSIAYAAGSLIDAYSGKQEEANKAIEEGNVAQAARASVEAQVASSQTKLATAAVALGSAFGPIGLGVGLVAGGLIKFGLSTEQATYITDQFGRITGNTTALVAAQATAAAERVRLDKQLAESSKKASQTLEAFAQGGATLDQALMALSGGLKEEMQISESKTRLAQAEIAAQKQRTSILGFGGPDEEVISKNSKTIEEETKNREKLATEALKKGISSEILRKAINNSIAAGKPVSAEELINKIIPKEARGMIDDEDIKNAELAINNMADAAQRNADFLRALNFGLQGVTAAIDARVVKVENTIASFEPGFNSLSIAARTLEASITAAGANIDSASIDKSLVSLEQQFLRFGGDQKEVENLSNTIRELNRIQKEAVNIIPNINKKLEENIDFTGGGTGLTDILKEELLELVPDDSPIRDRLLAIIGNLDFDKLPEEIQNQIKKGDISGLVQSVFGELGQATQVQIESFKKTGELQDKLKPILQKRIELEKDLVSAQKEALKVQIEAAKAIEKFGGPAVTFADQLENLNRQLNLDLAAAGIGGTASGSSPDDLVAINRRLVAEIESINAAGPLPEEQGEEQKARRSQLETLQKSLLDNLRQRIGLTEQEIELAKKKNDLEKSALQKLIEGDAIGFFEQQETAAAASALKSGDDRALRLFTQDAIGRAFASLQTEDQTPQERRRQARAALGGFATEENVSVLSETTPELLDLQRSGREAAQALREVADTASQIVKSDLVKVDANVVELRGQINEPQKVAGSTQGLSSGGTVYANNGVFVPRGTDTVPAMLTPGEFVVNRKAVQSGNNLSMLQNMNSGKTVYASTGGMISNGVLYASDGVDLTQALGILGQSADIEEKDGVYYMTRGDGSKFVVQDTRTIAAIEKAFADRRARVNAGRAEVNQGGAEIVGRGTLNMASLLAAADPTGTSDLTVGILAAIAGNVTDAELADKYQGAAVAGVMGAGMTGALNRGNLLNQTAISKTVNKIKDGDFGGPGAAGILEQSIKKSIVDSPPVGKLADSTTTRSTAYADDIMRTAEESVGVTAKKVASSKVSAEAAAKNQKITQGILQEAEKVKVTKSNKIDIRPLPEGKKFRRYGAANFETLELKLFKGADGQTLTHEGLHLASFLMGKQQAKLGISAVPSEAISALQKALAEKGIDVSEQSLKIMSKNAGIRQAGRAPAGRAPAGANEIALRRLSDFQEEVSVAQALKWGEGLKNIKTGSIRNTRQRLLSDLNATKDVTMQKQIMDQLNSTYGVKNNPFAIKDGKYILNNKSNLGGVDIVDKNIFNPKIKQADLEKSLTNVSNKNTVEQMAENANVAAKEFAESQKPPTVKPTSDEPTDYISEALKLDKQPRKPPVAKTTDEGYTLQPTLNRRANPVVEDAMKGAGLRSAASEAKAAKSASEASDAGKSAFSAERIGQLKKNLLVRMSRLSNKMGSKSIVEIFEKELSQLKMTKEELAGALGAIGGGAKATGIVAAGGSTRAIVQAVINSDVPTGFDKTTEQAINLGFTVSENEDLRPERKEVNDLISQIADAGLTEDVVEAREFLLEEASLRYPNLSEDELIDQILQDRNDKLKEKERSERLAQQALDSRRRRRIDYAKNFSTKELLENSEAFTLQNVLEKEALDREIYSSNVTTGAAEAKINRIGTQKDFEWSDLLSPVETVARFSMSDTISERDRLNSQIDSSEGASQVARQNALQEIALNLLDKNKTADSKQASIDAGVKRTDDEFKRNQKDILEFKEFMNSQFGSDPTTWPEDVRGKGLDLISGDMSSLSTDEKRIISKEMGFINRTNSAVNRNRDVFKNKPLNFAFEGGFLRAWEASEEEVYDKYKDMEPIELAKLLRKNEIDYTTAVDVLARKGYSIPDVHTKLREESDTLREAEAAQAEFARQQRLVEEEKSREEQRARSEKERMQARRAYDSMIARQKKEFSIRTAETQFPGFKGQAALDEKNRVETNKAARLEGRARRAGFDSYEGMLEEKKKAYEARKSESARVEQDKVFNQRDQRYLQMERRYKLGINKDQAALEKARRFNNTRQIERLEKKIARDEQEFMQRTGGSLSEFQAQTNSMYASTMPTGQAMTKPKDEVSLKGKTASLASTEQQRELLDSRAGTQRPDGYEDELKKTKARDDSARQERKDIRSQRDRDFAFGAASVSAGDQFEVGTFMGNRSVPPTEQAAMEIMTPENFKAMERLDENPDFQRGRIQGAALNPSVPNTLPGTGNLPGVNLVDEDRLRLPGSMARGYQFGGLIYASRGRFIPKTIFKPRGTDTVPAMLTPGEFVVNRQAVRAGNNLSILKAMNSQPAAPAAQVATMSNGGPVGSTQYFQNGGEVSGGGQDSAYLQALEGQLASLAQKLETGFSSFGRHVETFQSATQTEMAVNVNQNGMMRVEAGSSLTSSLMQNSKDIATSSVNGQIERSSIGLDGKTRTTNSVLG